MFCAWRGWTTATMCCCSCADRRRRLPAPLPPPRLLACSLLRQAPLAFDAAASLTHGHYRLELHEGGASGEAFATDSLWFPPPGNVLPRVFNDSLLMEGLLHLAQRSAAPRPAPGGGGVSRPVQRLTYDYLVGSTSAWQQAHVRRYVAAGMGGDAGWRQRTLLVLSLCIWEGTHVLPE